MAGGSFWPKLYIMTNIVVIPTYNEKENLPLLVEAIFALGVADLQIIVVDDNSPDGTGVVADELAKKYAVTVVHRQGKMGLGSAYIEGFRTAMKMGADLILEMDADFSHDPGDIGRLTKEAEAGHDLVIGSRRTEGGEIRGWSWWRKFESEGAMTFARFVLGLKTKDITAGFRCWRKDALQKINFERIRSNGYAFQEEMLYLSEKNNLKIKEIPVVFRDRKQGKSKLSYKDIIEFFMIILRLKFGRGRQLENYFYE